MTRRDERVNAHSSSHDVVSNPVHERVRCFRFRELHVRVANCFQGRVEEKFIVEKV